MAVDVKTAVRPSALVRAVPAWAWLAGLVAVSTVIRWGLGRRMVAPWIMVDELIYSELAKSFAATGQFLVRDHATAAYGVVYPALISPAWRLFSSVPDAYAAAKAINALLMSLAAVPAYFLARRVVSARLALLAAALTLAIPSMAFTGMLMTENAFYPLFLCAALALVAWLERPTARRTVLLLGVSALAFLTRAQALALLPAILTAPFLLAGRRALREYRLLYGLTAAGVVGVVVVQVARGASPLGVLGAYKVAGEAHYTVQAVSRWFLYHVAELDLSLGILPFAALLALALLARSLPREARAFVAAAAALSFWLVLEVAAFASKESLRVEERNMFYLAPLFLVALLVWIEHGLPARRAAAGAALVAAALPAALPFTSLIGLPAVSDTFGLLPLWSLSDATFLDFGQLSGVVALGGMAAGLAFLLVPQRLALVLPVLVLAYFAVSQKPIEGKLRTASVGSLFAGITAPHRDWVDRTVGRDADVVAIWSGNTDRYSIWENEFFNRSVGAVYDTAGPLSGGLPETAVQADLRTGLISAGGRPVRARYVLTDGSVSIAGRVIARDDRKGMLLYLVGGQLRQTTRVEGLYPQDTWSGREVTYTRLSCRGGRVVVRLQSDPALFTRPQTVVALVGGREVGRVRVPPRSERLLAVPLRREGDTCVARFTISPVAIPAVVTGGQNPDPRVLGIHFSSFDYQPPRG